MASAIDSSFPTAINPTTASVRANFDTARSEISALQAADTALHASSGSSLVGYLSAGTGAVATTIQSMLRESVSVMGFIPAGTNTITTPCEVYVQAAVNYCLANAFDLDVPVQILLSGSVNINRPVDTMADIFTIRGMNTTAGFLTNTAITMFSSTTVPITPGYLTTEYVAFDNIYFEASVNTLNCFVISDVYLRTTFNKCYFYKIRCVYSEKWFQSFHFIGCTILGMKGNFVETNRIVSPDPTGTSGNATDLHVIGCRFESCDRTSSAGFVIDGEWVGGGFSDNIYQSSHGPFVSFVRVNGGSLNNNYFEDVDTTPILLGESYTVTLMGNFFDLLSTVWAVDCGTSYTVVGIGNQSNQKMYINSAMQGTAVLNGSGFYKTISQGLLSLGDIAYSGAIADAVNELYIKHTLVDNTRFPSVPSLSTDVNTIDAYIEGLHTSTLNGFASPIAFFLYYNRIGNTVVLTLRGDATNSGTSNATSMVATDNLPSTLWPVTDSVVGIVRVIDSGTTQIGTLTISTTGVLTFNLGVASGNFTASGTKGVAPFTMSYLITS